MANELLQVGGLASGLDTNAIIDGLTNIEQTRVNREKNKQTLIKDKQSAFNDVISRVGKLATKASELDDIKAFNMFKTSSTDDSLITIEGSEDSIPGEYSVEAYQIATQQKVASKSFSNMTTGLGLTGEFAISVSRAALEADPAKTESTITISSTDALKDIAAKINAAQGTGVQASIMQVSSGDYRLVLTGVDEGSDHFFLRETSGTPLVSSGLGLIENTQKARSTNSFVLANGGTASSTTKFNELSTGIGNNNLSNGDIIRITGTDAQGNSVGPSDFSITPATSTMQDLLTSIQTAYGNVTASLNSSGEIVLTDTSGGTTALSLNLQFIDNDSSGSTLTVGGSKKLNSFSNVLQAGQKAAMKVDGLSISTQSNKDDSILTGSTLNLKKLELGTEVKVKLERDTDGLKSRIQGFLDEYNSLISFIDEKSKVEVEEEQENPLSGSKSKVTKKGPLYGDSTTRRIKNELQRMMTSPITELDGVTQYSSLARLGIVSDKTTGKLTVDDAKLKSAITADFEGVRRLFIASGYSDNASWELGNHTKDTETGTYRVDTATDDFDTDKSSSANSYATASRTGDALYSSNGDSRGLTIKAPLGTGSGNFVFARGLASQVKRYYDKSNDFVNGFFKEATKNFDTSIRQADKRITELQERVTDFRSKLVLQFSNLEKAMSQLKSQSAAFSAQVR